MNVTIISPTSLHTHLAQHIELETITGELTILMYHAPTIVTLKKNSICTLYLSDTEKKTYAVSQGIAHIDRKEVTIILDE
jgi:F0F1-type ATP synthase epsilon subunit